MKISTLVYSLKQGLKNIWRNKMFSLASVGTMTASIFLFGIFYSIVFNIQHIIYTAEESVCVTVFFDEGISDGEIEDIGASIQQRAEVSQIRFISSEEAWESFKDDYFKGAEELAEGFTDDNPLADSASYEVYLNDVSMQKSLVKYITNIDGVRQVNQSEVVANTLMDINKLVAYISGAIIAILLGVAIFLISNTVTIGIAVRKEEIGIMKLIGATDFFVKAPFVVEGMIIGLIGAILPLGILYVVYREVISFVLTKFHILSGFLTFLTVEKVFAGLIPVSLILGVGIGFAGSFFTIRKHLRV